MSFFLLDLMKYLYPICFSFWNLIWRISFRRFPLKQVFNFAWLITQDVKLGNGYQIVIVMKTLKMSRSRNLSYNLPLQIQRFSQFFGSFPDRFILKCGWLKQEPVFKNYFSQKPIFVSWSSWPPSCIEVDCRQLHESMWTDLTVKSLLLSTLPHCGRGFALPSVYKWSGVCM